LTGHFDATMPGWTARCCVGWTWSSRPWRRLDAVIIEGCQPWAHQIESAATIPA
jgi:hypothetical protein